MSSFPINKPLAAHDLTDQDFSDLERIFGIKFPKMWTRISIEIDLERPIEIQITECAGEFRNHQSRNGPDFAKGG